MNATKRNLTPSAPPRSGAPFSAAGTGRTGGFTLVELMVVIGIIALLLAISLPSILSIRREIRRSASLATIHMIEGGIRAYQLEFKDFPPSREAMYPAWQGRKLICMFLTGYAEDAGTVGVSGEDGQGLANDDGQTGFGFRIYRGMRHGPYNGLETARTALDGGRPVFVDQFDNPICYYRWNGSAFDAADDDVPGMPQYSQNSSGVYFRKDFLLCSPGPDKIWTAIRSDPATDDISNFMMEN